MTNILKKPLEIHAELSSDLFQELQNDKDGFLHIAQILRDLTGIHLPYSDKNLNLVASRLSRVMKAYELSSYPEYIRLLDSSNGVYIQEFISQLTTNTTHFFRESVHFDFLTKALPKLISKKRTDGKMSLKIWCAASSTGQEPYTLAISLLETIPTTGLMDIKILATDIDLDVLQKAEKGIYNESEIQGVAEELRIKYFDFNSSTGLYKVKHILKQLINFAEFNLTAETYPFHNHFDIVFCRNVLIYFERDLAVEVIRKLSRSLAISGLLFLGHSESGVVRTEHLKSVSSSVYEKIS